METYFSDFLSQEKIARQENQIKVWDLIIKRYRPFKTDSSYANQVIITVGSLSTERATVKLATHAVVFRGLVLLPPHKLWGGSNTSPLKNDCVGGCRETKLMQISWQQVTGTNLNTRSCHLSNEFFDY